MLDKTRKTTTNLKHRVQNLLVSSYSSALIIITSLLDTGENQFLLLELSTREAVVSQAMQK